MIFLASKVEKQGTLHILKETYNSFKTTLFEDFDRRFPSYGIPSPSAGRQDLHSFKLFGMKVNLLGADSVSKVHGSGSDYFYINEALPVAREIFDQFEMRNRKFWWMDYNPSVTHHWIYERLENREDVSLLRTTFLDNPHISNAEKVKILSYESTHPEDRHLPEKKRRPHPINIKQGTADAHSWNVYGLGLRSAPEGLVFQHVTWITEFPKNLDREFFGLDFGFTNDPSCLVRIGIKGTNVYAKKELYVPTPSSKMLIDLVGPTISDHRTWADSAEPGMIAKMRAAGLKVFGVKKFPGSIKYGIDTLKSMTLHLVEDPDVRKEQENYKYREIQGIRLNEPVDKFNHFWDALRYGVMMEVR